MRAAAIICEYNPFHNGHRLQIQQTRRLFPESCLIAVMSGSSVQRGDFAVFDKYDRAKQAVLNGIDLVFELPFPYSCSAGQQFARAGVYIANAVGADTLIFGSECGSAEKLRLCADRLASDEFDKALGKCARLHPGASFISIRETVYREFYGEPLPSGGNDILGIEYIKSIAELCPPEHPLTPIALKRSENVSATQSRRALYSGNYSEIARLLPGEAPPLNRVGRGLEGISGLVLGHLRLSEPEVRSNGIRNALISAARAASGYTEFLSLLPTKTYTLARLRREIIASLLSVSDADKNALPGYTVLLGASQIGLKYLSQIRKSAPFPVLTKYSDAVNAGAFASAQFKKAVNADAIAALTFTYPKPPLYFKEPFIQK